MEPLVDLSPPLAALGARLRELGSVLVCYSGGVDSAFLLAAAHRELGPRAVGMTAVSPSLAPAERDDAVDLARAIGADHRLVESREIEDPDYVKNAPDRCFHCKSELYRIATVKQREWGLAAIVNGTNTDDLGDYRPGLEAAKQAGVVSPLVELGFTKAMVREGAQSLGLPVWDKPAAACLSSRIPYGTSVTRERLPASAASRPPSAVSVSARSASASTTTSPASSSTYPTSPAPPPPTCAPTSSPPASPTASSTSLSIS
ncbi:MAG: ATP-dependent sacrificial sulfur transferase LarE [Polyangiaceae bacterium]